MKILKRILLSVFLLVLILISGIHFYVKLSLPDYDGEYRAAGIQGRTEIYRDASGLPHIFADSQDDLAFGMGFAMAQDRLWQPVMIT